MPKYDPTITLGNILTVLGLVAGAWWFTIVHAQQLDRIDYRVGVMWTHYKHERGIVEPGDVQMNSAPSNR